jgi:hypothetical protein
VCGLCSRSATGGARLLEDILRWGSEALFARPEGGAPAAHAADAAATAALAGDAAGPGGAGELKPGAAAGAPAPAPRAQGEGEGYSEAALDRLVAGPLRPSSAAGGGGSPGADGACAKDWAAAGEAGGLGPGLEAVAVREWRAEALEDEEAGSDGAAPPAAAPLAPAGQLSTVQWFCMPCFAGYVCCGTLCWSVQCACTGAAV